MYICICNPFSDKSVYKYLEAQEDKVTVSKVYKTCSGGEAPQCKTCLDTVKDIVREHNSKVTVNDLRKSSHSQKEFRQKTMPLIVSDDA